MIARCASESWLRMIAVYGLIIGLAYAWQAHGVNAAGNVYLALMWAAAIGNIVCGLTPTAPSATIRLRSKAQNLLVNFFRVASVAFIAATGHFVLFAFFLLGIGGSILYRERFDENGYVKPEASRA